MREKGYSKSAVILHFSLATGIFFLFISSWWMLRLPLASAEYQFRAFPFQLHKNIGITLVAVIVVMLYVRCRHRPMPPSPEALPPRTYKLAIVGHVALYLIILTCCVSGYLSSSYSGWGTSLWWLVELPDWGYENEELNVLYSDIHLWTCWILLAVLAVHIGGALYHGFRNDGIVRRMLHL